jgi:hypothetical protein
MLFPACTRTCATRSCFLFVPLLADLVADATRLEPNLWLPDTAARLAAAISAGGGPVGCDRAYGTARWLAQDPHHPCHVAGQISIGCHPVAVEILAPNEEALFSLPFESTPGESELSALKAAGQILGTECTVADTVGSLVRVVHVLKASSEMDMSHSDPRLPFSVFVSVPPADERDAILRLAESLLHEAMHLQLTLIEGVLPLVADERMSGFSPWQSGERPVRGLLHGLYVFAVITQVLHRFAGQLPEAMAYATRRAYEIANEVSQLSREQPGLTGYGRALWSRCRVTALDLGNQPPSH